MFIVVTVADQDNRVVFAGVTYHLEVDLGDQRTGRVYHLKLPLARTLPDFRRDAVSAVHQPAAGRRRARRGSAG